MCSVIEPDTSIRQNITAWATGFGTVSKRRKRMSIGSMNGMRRSFAFQRRDLGNQLIPARRLSHVSSSASNSSISSGRGRRSAIRRASARLTVRLIEILAGEPEVE